MRALLFRRQPLRIARPVDQEEPRHHTEHDARQAFDEKHPLPAGESERAGEGRHGPRRQRPTHYAAERAGNHHGRDRARHALLAVPVGQVKNHPRREAGFEYAKQKPQPVEHRHVVDEQHRCGCKAPQHQNAADRFTRAQFRQQQVARHFEQHIAEEEDARGDAIDRVRKVQIGLHLQFRKADVEAVETGKQVADQQKRQQTQIEPAVERRGLVCARIRWNGGHGRSPEKGRRGRLRHRIMVGSQKRDSKSN